MLVRQAMVTALNLKLVVSAQRGLGKPKGQTMGK